MREAKWYSVRRVYYPEKLRSGAMSYLDDLFRVIVFGFVIVFWTWKICGVMAHLERRNKLTRAEKLSEVFGGGWRYKGASKGRRLSERAMWRWCGCGAYWLREDGASEKKWQELLVPLTASYEGAM